MTVPNTHGIPFLLRAYLAAGRLMPGMWWIVARRAHVRQGGEPDRLRERLSHATCERPNGKVIWIHAASVGELTAVLDLGRQLGAETGASILFTTVTSTAAGIAARRMHKGALHQYFPTDTRAAAARFLDHWRPGLAIVAESDLWPALLVETAQRRIPLALVNARPSRSRKRAPGVARALLGLFDCITAKDRATHRELVELGLDPERLHAPGDLKSATDPIPVDEAALAEFRSVLGTRPIWVAASTHAGEDEMVTAAHRAALNAHPELLLVLIPRHPERGPDVAAMLRLKGFNTAVRTEGGFPDTGTEVYLADTLGETGLFYRLAPLVFLGGSFKSEGGHNPYEPLASGSAVLHGPNVTNFAAAYEEMNVAGATRPVEDADALGRAVTALSGSAELLKMGEAAQKTMSERATARTTTLKLLLALLAHPVQCTRPGFPTPSSGNP